MSNNQTKADLQAIIETQDQQIAALEISREALRDMYREACADTNNFEGRINQANGVIRSLQEEVDFEIERHGDHLMETQTLIPLLQRVLSAKRPKLRFQNERIPF